MTKQSRKGNKGEAEVEALLRKHGILAYKRGGPGMHDGEAPGLIDRYEVKKRAGVPSQVYKWLAEHSSDALFMQRSSKHEHKRWLVVMEAEDWAQIIGEFIRQIDEWRNRVGQDAVLRSQEHLQRRIEILEETVNNMPNVIIEQVEEKVNLGGRPKSGWPSRRFGK